MWQSTKNIYHLFQAIGANVIYGFPSRGMKIIGVTGTDGKTTTANLLYHILIQSGYKASLISTVGAVINDKSSDIGLHITTPGRFALQSYMKKSKKAGVHYVILEITSHGLDQHRAYGIPIAVGVLTNVSNEHLDYHKNYTRYIAAKAKLLKQAKVAVLNKDDRSYFPMMKHLKKKSIITYGFKKDSKINPHNFHFRTKLMGKFNEYNALAAIAALQALHIPDEAIRKGIANFKAPIGRQEVLYDKEFIVINDFAHTPNSFSVILPEVKKLAKNRLIHIFGSAAKRDKYKRPEMGTISSKYADIIILTSEDPRDEPIENINKDILAGIKDNRFLIVNGSEIDITEKNVGEKAKFVYVIPDRKAAIEFAIKLAKKGDVVLMTGKGHEKSINYGKGEEPWDENQTARKAIEMKNER
jgi:UDP-N-acetylmuramoyl-L-alanyl-D-glutamate--2,6-diaminopimelate ligase